MLFCADDCTYTKGLSQDIFSFLLQQGVDCEQLSLHGDPRLCPEEQSPPFCQDKRFSPKCLVIALGRETLLAKATAMAAVMHFPILRLGTERDSQLSDLPAEEWEQLWKLLQGAFEIKSCLMLAAHVKRGNSIAHRIVVAGDLAITGTYPGQIVHLNTFVAEELLWELHGDGVVISTPTGAGGYSYRAGGCWMDPSMQNYMVTPICCHSIKMRPVILSHKQTLKVSQANRSYVPVRIIVDGCYAFHLKQGDSLIISAWEQKSFCVRLNGSNIFSY
ncbi:NAD(+)/NADH kinase [Agathobaculum sp. TL06]